jgi:hypothetical protein
VAGLSWCSAIEDGCILPHGKGRSFRMTEEALRGWYWAGVIVFALAVLVGWYMQ